MISEELKNDLKIKWDRMRDGMAKMGMDACLLTVDVNLYYTTGQIYSGYFYLPVDGEPWFLIKRPNGLSGHQVEYIRKPEDIPPLFAERGIKMPKRLLLEADELTYNEYIRLQKVFQPEEAGNATAFMRNLRRVKTPWEIGQFRIAARKHEATYSEIPECFRPGMTDLEFQYEIEKRMRKNGSIGLFRAFGANMDIYMGSILAGENAETPSPFDFALGGGGIDASCPLGANGTLLKEGTAIMVDMAGNYTAYMTDMTRVFSVGRLTEEAYRAHQVALTIQQEVENATRPGTACSDLYNIAANIAKKEGLSANFMGTEQQAKFVGHGIGIQINELPVLTPRSKEELLPNMVFALEPKFVIPGVGAVGIENSFLVTETGVEKLTRFNEEIIPLGNSDSRSLNFWTLDEYKQFIQTMEPGTRYYLMFEMLFWTGCRIGELLAITKADINFEKNQLSINKTYYRTGMQDIITEPKTKQSFRTIEIPEFLKEEIKEFVDGHYGMPDTERLFPVVQEAVQHKMKRQIELAGVKKIRVHDIRHSHVAYLIEKGVEPLLIRDRLGHKDIRITLNTYGHLYPNQQRKIANLLDNENGNAVTGLGEERDEC